MIRAKNGGTGLRLQDGRCPVSTGWVYRTGTADS